MTGEHQFTQDDFEGMLLDLLDQVKKFPTDEILRESNIPEVMIAQVGVIADTIQDAISLLRS
jgi:hypothetical protein